MDLISETNIWKFMDEERKNINLPRRFSFGNTNEEADHNSHDLSSARTSCVSAASYSLWPTSTETPWTRSPPPTSPNCPPLLYHCLASLHRSEGNIFSITVTKDFIFTGSSSCRIHAWKQPDCAEMGFIKATTGQIRAILATGKLLITAHGDCRVRVWDLPQSDQYFKPRKITTLPRRRSFFSYSKKSVDQHKDFIQCLAYNLLEKLLYTGSSDQTVKVWRISEQKCIDSFVAHEGQVNAIVVNQSDGCVFTCSSDGTVKIWRRVFGETSHILTMTLKFQPSPINALALSSSSNDCFLYSGSSDGLINFWEKERVSGRYNHAGFVQGHHFAVMCLVTVEELILSGSEDATIRIWKREEGNSFHSCLAVIDGHHGPVKCLTAVMETNDVVKGLLVYSASLDQTLKVWRVKVYPSEKVSLDHKLIEGGDEQLELVECKMSPVLSPSWVEKKIQGSDY